MQLVDQGICDRCGKSGEIVRLIPKDDIRGFVDLLRTSSIPYVILCRTCLAYSWKCLDSEEAKKEMPKGNKVDVTPETSCDPH